MARATAQWEALTARGLEHHTRTSDKRGFCGPTQGIRGAGAAEVLRGLHPCFGKPPSSSPGAFWLRSCAHTVAPPITPPPPPRPRPRPRVPRVPRGSPGENGYDATLVS